MHIPIFVPIPFSNWESLTIEEKKRIIEEECDADEQDFPREWDGTRYMKYLDQGHERLAAFWFWLRVAINCLATFLVFAVYFAAVIALACLVVEHFPMVRWDAPWHFAKLAGLICLGGVLMTIPAYAGLHAVFWFSEWLKYRVKF